MINAIKFAIEEIEASDQYFDHTGSLRLHVAFFRPVILCEVPTAYFQAEAENRMSNRRVFH